jgi:hypothetical protein
MFRAALSVRASGPSCVRIRATGSRIVNIHGGVRGGKAISKRWNSSTTIIPRYVERTDGLQPHHGELASYSADSRPKTEYHACPPLTLTFLRRATSDPWRMVILPKTSFLVTPLLHPSRLVRICSADIPGSKPIRAVDGIPPGECRFGRGYYKG